MQKFGVAAESKMEAVDQNNKDLVDTIKLLESAGIYMTEEAEE